MKTFDKIQEIDSEARISKEAGMRNASETHQKRITPLDIQLSSLTFLQQIITVKLHLIHTVVLVPLTIIYNSIPYYYHKRLSNVMILVVVLVAECWF